MRMFVYLAASEEEKTIFPRQTTARERDWEMGLRVFISRARVEKFQLDF